MGDGRPRPKVAAAARRPERDAPPRRRRGIVRFTLAGVVLVGLLFAFVYPTRTFLDQRSDTQRARAQLELLRSENAELATEAERLQQPAEIEKLARRYGLVKPNERAFVIVPKPTAPPAAVGAAPAPEGTVAPAP